MLDKKYVSTHYLDKIDLPLRGFIRCSDCGRLYTPYNKKGNIYYRVRCNKECINSRKNLKLSTISQSLVKIIATLCNSASTFTTLDAESDSEISLLTSKYDAQHEENEKAIKKLNSDLSFIQENKLSLIKSQVYSIEGLVAEQERIEHKILKLERQNTVSQAEIDGFMNDLEKVTELLKLLTELYRNAKREEIENIIKMLITELSISSKTLEYKLEKGLSCLKSLNFASSGQIAWFTEFIETAHERKSLIFELEEALSECSKVKSTSPPKSLI